MFNQNEAEKSFCMYAMELFINAGHTTTPEPVFTNHSPERVLYFDYSAPSLSPDQRALFAFFNNVSCLFSANGCVFFSINLLSTKRDRSQVAHDIHSMLHPFVKSKGTICFFQLDDEVMLSFVGFGFNCVLSDWFSIYDDSGSLQSMLDIVNMSVCNERAYFSDFVYVFARAYYRDISKPTIYDAIPKDTFLLTDSDEIDREELDQIVQEQLLACEQIYGDDYVPYNEKEGSVFSKVKHDLDFLLLEIDEEYLLAEESDNNTVVEDIFDEETTITEDQRDVYEYSDMNPEIFKDPLLLVKWLERGGLPGDSK